MDIHRLYKLINIWEVALTVTKPEYIKRLWLKPIIYNDIKSCGEGKIWGSLELTVEKKDLKEEFVIFNAYKEYKTVEESEEAQEGMILCLIDYLEVFLSDEKIQSIWEEINDSALDWN